MRCGYGIQKWVDGAVYEGEWKHDALCGRGKAMYTSGAVYEGEFEDGKCHGHGPGPGRGPGDHDETHL